MNQTKALFILSFICVGYLCNSQLIKYRESQSEEIRGQTNSMQIDEPDKTKISQNQGKKDSFDSEINRSQENNIDGVKQDQLNLNLKTNPIKRNIRVSLNEDSLLIISPQVTKNQDSQQNKIKPASEVKKASKKKKKGKKSKKSKKNKDKDTKNNIIDVTEPLEKKKQSQSEQIKQNVPIVKKEQKKIQEKVQPKIEQTVQTKVQPKIQQVKSEQKINEITTQKKQNIQEKQKSQLTNNMTDISTPNQNPISVEKIQNQLAPPIITSQTQQAPPITKQIQQAPPTIQSQTKEVQKVNEIETENERMQRQKAIQEQIKTQEQLKKARDEIIFRRQEQIKRLQAQAKKRAEQNKPVEMVELKPYYCGPSIYQNRRKNLPQPVPNARQRLVQTVYGFSMYVDSKDYMVSNSITASGTWEPGYINLIGHLVKPGNKVINLGSQSGLQALVMGKIVGKNGKLFIFEPYSFSNNLITKNIALNQLQDITTIYKYGASDEKTTATIRIAYSNTGGSQIVPSQTPNVAPANNPYAYNSGFNQIQQVQIDKVDALLPKDVQLDFALLDVEKMEIKAMKGMKQIIERSPNLVIMTQWQYGQNPRRNRQETVQFLNYMIERGYKIYSYNGGNVVNCSVGQFHEYPNIQVLLGINFIDIFFFPKDYVLPK